LWGGFALRVYPPHTVSFFITNQKNVQENMAVKSNPTFYRLYRSLTILGVLALTAALIRGWTPATKEAPEAAKIMAIQAKLPFQILIPAYLPVNFNRADVQVQVDDQGPGGEPMVQLTYRTTNGDQLFVREWVPVRPELEILSASRPIETKWGQGWLLAQGQSLAALWVDVGPLRTSVYTHSLPTLKVEDVLQIAETLGPASNRQVFSFVVATSTVKEMAPPPPLEIKPNSEGVQEVTLVVTPGGYSPLRFSVKKGLPVRLIFRQLGEVGCGNELIFPADPKSPVSLTIKNPQDRVVYEFTPQQVGEFQFFCSHQMYRGVLTVHE
jgi:hypothetical protein